MKDLDYNILKNYLSTIYKKKDSKEINELCEKIVEIFSINKIDRSNNDHCGPCGYDKLGYKIERDKIERDNWIGTLYFRYFRYL